MGHSLLGSSHLAVAPASSTSHPTAAPLPHVHCCRVALASCCRVLWARPDVLGSRVLWGHLAFNSGRLMDLEHWRQSLCTWLARRHQALHTMYLMFVEAQTDLAAILAGLAGSSLAHLRLSYIRGGLTEARCQPLARLAGSLTRLELNHCSLAALPSQVSALSSLVHLDLSSNEHALARLDLSESHSLGSSGGGDSAAAAWQPLLHLGATLTFLSLAQCGLDGLPGQLTALTALQELVSSSNRFARAGEGEGGQAAWHHVGPGSGAVAELWVVKWAREEWAGAERGARGKWAWRAVRHAPWINGSHW